MSTARLFLGFLLAGLPLFSEGQTVSLTPKNLGDWSLLGADREAVTRRADLSLPAGAQLSRTFPAGNITIALATRSSLTFDTADWPVLELGTVALVFSRREVLPISFWS